MSRKLRYGIWREGGGGEAKGKVRSKGSVRRDHQIQFMVTTAIVRVIARKAFSHIAEFLGREVQAGFLGREATIVS